MDKQTLEEILEYTRKGATLDLIAKHYGMSLRTLSRKLKDYKQELGTAREYYKSVVEGMFR